MKIDSAWHFGGSTSLPPAFQGDGPYELTLEQIATLVDHYAVLLYKDRGDTVIAFDDHRGRFKQR